MDPNLDLQFLPLSGTDQWRKKFCARRATGTHVTRPVQPVPKRQGAIASILPRARAAGAPGEGILLSLVRSTHGVRSNGSTFFTRLGLANLQVYYASVLLVSRDWRSSHRQIKSLVSIPGALAGLAKGPRSVSGRTKYEVTGPHHAASFRSYLGG